MSTSRGLFVTGTDTGVGKTLVSCAILRALRRQGLRLAAYKPSETGCPRDASGALYGEDCRRLLAAADTGQPESTVATALYPVPAAPLVSAEAEGESLDPEQLVADCGALAADHPDGVLVEGAGGLLVPIAEGFTFADLAERLGLPVVVVVGSRLGCINHALLTLSELAHRDIPVAGWVLNSVDAESDAPHALATNRDVIRRFAEPRSWRDLGHMPFLAAGERDDLDALGALAAERLDLAALAPGAG